MRGFDSVSGVFFLLSVLLSLAETFTCNGGQVARKCSDKFVVQVLITHLNNWLRFHASGTGSPSSVFNAVAPLWSFWINWVSKIHYSIISQLIGINWKSIWTSDPAKFLLFNVTGRGRPHLLFPPWCPLSLSLSSQPTTWTCHAANIVKVLSVQFIHSLSLFIA